MIPRLLWLALLWLARLIIPGEPVRVRVDPTARCTACGHRKGTVTTVEAVEGTGKFFVRHNCETCECRWYEDILRTDIKIKAAPDA